MKATFFILSLVAAESFAANWTTVWSDYKQERPVDPTVVFVNFFVRSIRNVNADDMTYDVQLTYREQWRDLELAYDPPNPAKANSTYETVSKELVWRPDSFFANEISGHDFSLMSDNSLVRVYPNGEILMSRRIQLKLSCPMNLLRFPFDTQECSIKIASYGHTTEQLVYLWAKTNPVQVTKSLLLREFLLTEFRTDYCTSRTNTGEYSCLVARFVLARNWYLYIFKVFMPVLMLAVLAYMTTWIKDTAARAILLSVVFALALVGYCSLSFVLPATSYSKLIDRFLVVSLIFIFGIVVKFSIDWSRRRTFEKNDSLTVRDIIASVWYPIAYVFIVIYILCFSNGLLD